jgi:hypothetical protein
MYLSRTVPELNHGRYVTPRTAQHMSELGSLDASRAAVRLFAPQSSFLFPLLTLPWFPDNAVESVPFGRGGAMLFIFGGCNQKDEVSTNTLSTILVDT